MSKSLTHSLAILICHETGLNRYLIFCRFEVTKLMIERFCFVSHAPTHLNSRTWRNLLSIFTFFLAWLFFFLIKLCKSSTLHITDLDRLNMVKLCNVGLVLGSNKFLPLSQLPQNVTLWLKNNHLALLI